MSNAAKPDAPVRIDRWLWAARIYKTRSQASAAVRGGRVQVNGQRAKPSRAVVRGDKVRASRDEWRIELIVDELSDKRGSAPIAATLYTETEHSIEQRLLQREQKRSQRAAAPAGRPDKKARRQLRKLARKD